MKKTLALVLQAESIFFPRIIRKDGKTWYGFEVWLRVGNCVFSAGPFLSSGSFARMSTCATLYSMKAINIL